MHYRPRHEDTNDRGREKGFRDHEIVIDERLREFPESDSLESLIQAIIQTRPCFCVIAAACSGRSAANRVAEFRTSLPLSNLAGLTLLRPNLIHASINPPNAPIPSSLSNPPRLPAYPIAPYASPPSLSPSFYPLPPLGPSQRLWTSRPSELRRYPQS